MPDHPRDSLFLEHWHRIRTWALYECGDPATADDVCQEAWLRVRRTSVEPDPDRNVQGWLRTIVRSVARDLLRREHRLHREVPTRTPPGAPDRQIDLKRGADRMLAAFATLTPRQREAVDRVDRLGMSAAEAAAEMGVSPGTVRVLLHEGRKALRQHLLAAGIHELVRST